MEEANVTWLRSLKSLEEVPPAQLQWLLDNTQPLSVAAGETLFAKGEPMRFLYIVVSGKVNIYSPQGHNQITIVLETGDISGLLPFSRMKLATGSGIAAVATELLVLPAEQMRVLIQDHYELCEALVHIMISRVRSFTSLQQQNEKMMALGKLSAGLAHELNNPASAIVRDAHSLRRHLSIQPESFKAIMKVQMTSEEIDAVSEVLFNSLARERPALTLMERTDHEDEMVAWLDERGVNNSGILAESFTDIGFCVQDFKDFSAHIPTPSLGPVFKWVSDTITTDKMVGDIGEAAKRIETLIASIKSFTHMDRGQEAQYADIHTGIRNTLTMLGHKIRTGNVKVIEAFDTTLPQVKAMIGELNQVWTNLMDNALDAMESRSGSELRITTLRDGNDVKVRIADNGPGIPEEMQHQIFDPFFTTKDIGKGTGLGLDMVQRIVQQHHGSVNLSSVPGSTIFTVCFPING